MVLGDDRLPTLTAARVSLRWLELADVPALFTLFSDPEVARFWSSPAMTALGQAQRLLAQIHNGYARGDLLQWGIEHDGAIIGTCTLSHVEVDHRRAEVGFALARNRWGQGLAREAVSRLLGFAFGPLALHRLEADVDPRNARSLGLLASLGFRREGLLRERWHVAGEICDAVFLGLLARDFEAHSAV